jgi:hypothetical protein
MYQMKQLQAVTILINRIAYLPVSLGWIHTLSFLKVDITCSSKSTFYGKTWDCISANCSAFVLIHKLCVNGRQKVFQTHLILTKVINRTVYENS